MIFAAWSNWSENYINWIYFLPTDFIFENQNLFKNAIVQNEQNHWFKKPTALRNHEKIVTFSLL